MAGNGPKFRVCHLCGARHMLGSFYGHLDKCKRLWVTDEQNKADASGGSRKMRPVPPEPQLPNGQEVNELITDEELELLNQMAVAVWKSMSLEECPNCKRTFVYEQLVKHAKGCHPKKHLQGALHEYRKVDQSVRQSKDKRDSDRKWLNPKTKKLNEKNNVRRKRVVPPAWASDHPSTMAAAERGVRADPLDALHPDRSTDLLKYGSFWGGATTNASTVRRETTRPPRKAPTPKFKPSASASASAEPPPPPPPQDRAARTRKPDVPASGQVDMMRSKIAELEDSQRLLLEYLGSIEAKLHDRRSEAHVHSAAALDRHLTSLLGESGEPPAPRARVGPARSARRVGTAGMTQSAGRRTQSVGSARSTGGGSSSDRRVEPAVPPPPPPPPRGPEPTSTVGSLAMSSIPDAHARKEERRSLEWRKLYAGSLDLHTMMPTG